MSLCINPQCDQPDHPQNDGSQTCQSCGSDLLLLGRYRVMRLLSDSSGFGRLYEAFDRSTPKILKVLKETYSHHVKAVELFRQEALVLGQLPHPGIPAVEPQSYFEFHPTKGEPLHCIIMEKIDGPNLKDWMRQQGYHPISEQQAIQWLHQLAEILHLVHRKNYFHRDIKPENIMLRSSGQLVLVDFGAAREMTYSYLAQMDSTGGTRISSAGYTPPEQERGQAVPQSDFYALGYSLIYLLTGKGPTDPEIYDSLQNQIQWRRFAPQVSAPLADLIDRLIAPKASDRPQDTADLLRQIALLMPSSGDHAPELPTTIMPLLSREQAVQQRVDQAIGAELVKGANPLPERFWAGALAVLLVAGGYIAWQLKPSYIWQATQSQSISPIRTIADPSGTIKSLTYTPDGQRLITGSDDYTIKIWNNLTGERLLTLTGHTSAIRSLAVKSDGSTLVSASDDQTIKLWNLGIGQQLRTITGHTSYINGLAISPDGQLLASASADQTVKLWNLATGQSIRTFTGHQSYVNAVVFSPDGHLIASASADQTVKLWNVTTGVLVRTLKGHQSYVNAVAFTPDGKQLVSASADKTLKIWDLQTGAEVRTITGHSSFVETLAISPDGQRLISGSADKTLKTWDLSSGELLHSLTGFDAHIRYIAPNPDWESVAVATERTVKIVKLPPY